MGTVSLYHSGNAEVTKGAYHAAMGLLALGALAYNARAWWLRRESHLAANVAVYSTLVVLEARKTAHHWESR